ncbi:hypothetical protein ACOME3_005952 [Neoechinorhynchus agilis]
MFESQVPPMSRFILLDFSKLSSLALLVYAREDILIYINEVAKGSLPRGPSNIPFNKGAVAVGLKLHETSICFVGAHFHAHDFAVSERNEDYNAVHQELKISDGKGNQRKIDENDFVFFMGDLNYRLNSLCPTKSQNTDASVNQMITDFDELSLALKERQYLKLIEYDQLRIERQKGKTFIGYHETPIRFKPTFKYIHNTDTYQFYDGPSSPDGKLVSRRPAWPDRILVGINSPGLFYFSDEVSDSTRPGCVLACEYGSVEKIKFSDHRPVRAIFRVDMIVGL